MITNILLSAFEIFFSKNCLVCQSYVQTLICHRCCLPAARIIKIERESLPNKVISHNVIDNFYSIWSYDKNVRDLFLAIKFKPSLSLIRYTASLLAADFEALYRKSKWDIIIPLPCSREGLKLRGFNHVYELFFHIVRKIKQADYMDSLIRRDNRLSQSRLSRLKRLRGLSSRYTLRSPSKYRGKKILLVDDILTTGSTVTAAAITLKKAGASSIDVFTVCYNYRN